MKVRINNDEVDIEKQGWLDSNVATIVENHVRDYYSKNKRLPTAASEWKSILKKNNVKKAVEPFDDKGNSLPELGLVFFKRDKISDQVQKEIGAIPIDNTDLVAARSTNSIEALSQELSLKEALDHMSTLAPEAIQNLFVRPERPWQTTGKWIDAFNQWDETTKKNIVSPIGIINLFRQFFYDFGSILGPPIDHVWISPKEYT